MRTLEVALVVDEDPPSEERVRRAGVCPRCGARFRGGKTAGRSLDPSPTARVGAGDGEGEGEGDDAG